MLSAAGANLEAESPVESGAESEEESVSGEIVFKLLGWESGKANGWRVRLWYVGSA